jgi:hypothetical protein
MRINAPTQLYSILFDEAAHEKTHKDIWWQLSLVTVGRF